MTNNKRKMTIEDVVNQYPGEYDGIHEAGLHCVGCHVSGI